jgi:hypothetical protein
VNESRPQPQRIETVAIVTGRRPAALQRCLASYISNARRFGHTATFVVSDDSTSEGARRVCREVVAAAARQYHTRVEYIGAEARNRLVERIAVRSSVPDEIVRFALSSSRRLGLATIGANRNTLLLSTRQRPVLFVDDDTVCETAVPMEGAGEADDALLWSGGRREPMDIWPLGNAADERAVYEPRPIDVLAEHERWLGRTPSERELGWRTRSGRRAPFGDPGPGATGGPVAVTVNGFIGDCGWGSPSSYLFLRGPSLARLTAGDESYAGCVTSRHIMRAVPRPTLCARADDFMSTCFGLANDAVVPPFAPLCRGSDRVFAALVNTACRHLFGYIPLVVSHRPEQPRQFWPGEVARSASGTDLCTVLSALIYAAPNDATSSSTDQLRRCGAYLRSIASSSDFAAVARTEARRALQAQIVELEHGLGAANAACLRFTKDASAYIARLRVTMERPDVHVPLDLRLARTDDNPGSLLQQIVAMFGETLLAWPDILAAAERENCQI